MRAKKFVCITGVEPGYNRAYEGITNPVQIVAKLWQTEAQKLYKESGIYISAVIKECTTVYSTEWGCPINGETTVEISGVQNPTFVKSDLSYVLIVDRMINIIKEKLNQSTMTVEYSYVEIDYKTSI